MSRNARSPSELGRDSFQWALEAWRTSLALPGVRWQSAACQASEVGTWELSQGAGFLEPGRGCCGAWGDPFARGASWAQGAGVPAQGAAHGRGLSEGQGVWGEVDELVHGEELDGAGGVEARGAAVQDGVLHGGPLAFEEPLLPFGALLHDGLRGQHRGLHHGALHDVLRDVPHGGRGDRGGLRYHLGLQGQPQQLVGGVEGAWWWWRVERLSSGGGARGIYTLGGVQGC